MNGISELERMNRERAAYLLKQREAKQEAMGDLNIPYGYEAAQANEANEDLKRSINEAFEAEANEAQREATLINDINEANEANEATNGRACDHIVCNELKEAFMELDTSIQLQIVGASDPIVSMGMTLYAVGATDPDLARSALMEIGTMDPLQGIAVTIVLDQIANS